MTFSIYAIACRCEDNYYPDYTIVKAFASEERARQVLAESYTSRWDEYYVMEIKVEESE